MSVVSVFIAGAAVHVAAIIGFGMITVLDDSAKRRAYASLATLVVANTAIVYAAQTDDVGRFTRRDGTVQFVAEWIGYALSLPAIGYALATSLGVVDAGALLAAALSLGFVGGGGVLGLFVATGFQQTVVFVGTSVLYAVFFAVVWRDALRTRRGALLVYFAAVTVLFYIVPYAFGPPVLDVWSDTTEHIFYLIGNVFSKIALPLLEISLVRSSVDE